MTIIERIAEAMLKEGYLSRENVEAAKTLLTKHLSATDREKFRELEADSHLQEQMILKDKPYAEQDAERGDKKSLKVDREIIRGAFNQDEVDLAKLQALETRIAKQAKKATKAMVSAGLVSKQNQKLTIELIQQSWISE